MKLEKIFFEYLIVGSLALVWFYPLLLLFDFNMGHHNFDGVYVLLLIPFIYVIGMIINFLAENMFRPIRRKIERRIIGEDESNKMDYYELIVKLTQKDNKLIDEFYLRSNRVRVAAGTLLNLLIAALVFLLLGLLKSEWPMCFKIIPFLLGGILLFFFMLKYYAKKHFQLISSMTKNDNF